MGSGTDCRRRRTSWGCTRAGMLVGLYGAIVLAIPFASHSTGDPVPVVTAPTRAPSSEAAPASDTERVRALAGVWQRYPRGQREDPLRFYYFHGDGKGLYRYGKTALNNTHSFDYDVRGDRLILAFRKTGARHEVEFRVERDARGDERLILQDDPEERGTAEYVRERSGPIEHMQGPPPAGHMWIDMQRYATGGCGFHFYQLRPAGIDGRGVGWFHRGDFDDWSTEALVYRITGETIELDFSLAGQREVTPFSIEGSDDARVLTLAADPRDYGHVHGYRDAGPSFGLVEAGPTRPCGGDRLSWVAASVTF